MKTKTLILMAAMAVVGGVSALAQTPVYSQNVVGYVNVSCHTGFNLIANPLSNGNNTLSTILPAPTEGTAVYTFRNGSYQIASFEQDDNGNLGWSSNPTIAPGEGIFVKANTAFSNTFVGEVVQGATTNHLNSGYNLVSSKVPQSGALDTVLGFAPVEGDAVYLYRNNAYQIASYERDDNDVLGWSTGTAPVPAVAEGFFVKTSVPRDWTRSFTVN